MREWLASNGGTVVESLIRGCRGLGEECRGCWMGATRVGKECGRLREEKKNLARLGKKGDRAVRMGSHRGGDGALTDASGRGFQQNKSVKSANGSSGRVTAAVAMAMVMKR